MDRSSCTCCTACKGPCPPCTDYSAFSKLSTHICSKSTPFQRFARISEGKKGSLTGKEGRKTSLFALGTLMAIPRFSNWLVPSGTRPPGTKVLTGRELPSLAMHKAMIMKILGENLPPGWTRHWHCRLLKDAKLAEAKFPNCCKASAHCQQTAWEPSQRFSLGPLQPLHRHPPQNISRARINIWWI